MNELKNQIGNIIVRRAQPEGKEMTKEMEIPRVVKRVDVVREKLPQKGRGGSDLIALVANTQSGNSCVSSISDKARPDSLAFSDGLV